MASWPSNAKQPPFPAVHANSHQHGGADEVASATPAANAIPKAGSSGTLNEWLSAALRAVGALTPAASKVPVYTSGSDASLADAGEVGLDVLAATTEAEGRAAIGAEVAGAADDAVADHVAEPDPHTQYLLAAGDTLTGTLDAGSQAVTNLPTPTSSGDAATKGYVDALVQGLDLKASVRVATTTALPSYGASGGVLTASANGALPAIDGVTLAAGESLLVKDEAGGNAPRNGIYIVTQVGSGGTPWILTRRTDANSSAEVTAGLFVYVAEGTTQAANGYVLSTADPITLDTTSLAFTQFSGAGQIVDGPALTKSGNTLGVNVDDATIEINSDALRIKAGGVTTAKLADAALQQIAQVAWVTGDVLYAGASALTRLAGNTTATRKWLSMTSSVPTWRELLVADVSDFAASGLRGVEFGTGRDGNVVADGTNPITINGVSLSPASSSYTLTSTSGSIQAKSLTLSNGVRIRTQGWLVKAWELVGPASGMAYIEDDGSSASGGTAGTGLSASGILQRSGGPGANGRASDGAGNSATNQSTPCFGGQGGAGGSGGTGGAAGSAGTIAASTDAAGLWSEAVDTLLCAARLPNGTAPKGGSGGGGGGRATGGSGTSGGSGGSGGVCIVGAGKVTNGAGITLSARGGGGGNASGTLTGGGGGGGGGAVGLRYGAADTVPTLSVAGGTGGTGAGGGSNGSDGSAGTTSALSYLA